LDKSVNKQVDTFSGMKVQTIFDTTMGLLSAKKLHFFKQLATDDWQTATGGWQTATGGWQLAAGSKHSR